LIGSSRNSAFLIGPLKAQFDLEDEHLEALKDELIEAKQLAKDENGTVAVRTGEAEPTSAATSAPASARPQQEQPLAYTPHTSPKKSSSRVLPWKANANR
jgi:hypothetical protein